MSTRSALIDELFQLLANLEEGKPFRRDGNRISGSGISPCVGFVRTNRKASESANFDSVALLQSLRHRIKHAVDDELSTRLRKLASCGDGFDQLTLCHSSPTSLENSSGSFSVSC